MLKRIHNIANLVLLCIVHVKCVRIVLFLFVVCDVVDIVIFLKILCLRVNVLFVYVLKSLC